MYLLDSKKQIALIREMEMVQKDTRTAEAYYHHPSTGMLWKSFFPQATNNNRGTKILRTEPVPEPIEEWLSCCLTSHQLDDARGLGLELSTQPERWKQIIAIIADNYRSYGRKQLKIFFTQLGIKNYEQLFDRLDMQIETLNLNRQTLDNLARQVRKIRFKRFWTF